VIQEKHIKQMLKSLTFKTMCFRKKSGQETIKSSECAAIYLGTNRLGSAFVTLR